jgi:hypothetical protein
MEALQPRGVLVFAIIVGASLVVLVYVFLRIAGIIGRKANRDDHPPPPTPLG